MAGRLIESGLPSSSRPKPLGAFRSREIKGFGLSEICSETSYTPSPPTPPSPAAEQIVFYQGLEAAAHNMFLKLKLSTPLTSFSTECSCVADVMLCPYRQTQTVLLFVQPSHKHVIFCQNTCSLRKSNLPQPPE